MKKRMFIMLLILGILFGLIILYKVFVSFIIKKSLAANQSPIISVSATKVGYASWQPKLTASGSLRAIKGVNVTTELAGMVQHIYFTPGSQVTDNQVLVQLNADSEIGHLQSLQAQAALAKITYDRDVKQLAIHAVSQQTVDTDYQNLKSLEGQVKEQAATVAKKTIRAPFSGRLGINYVNPGQYINPGDSVTSLQTLDPIYADFYMPQQTLASLRVGLPVKVISEGEKNTSVIGKITTINPAVQVDSRNVLVEATVANPNNTLTPGAFVTVDVFTGKPKKLLTLPQTAISFNPYGDIVYIILNKGKDEKGDILIVNPAFVVLGETRGDQVTILKGIKEGDMVVTSGQLKLKKDSRVKINNSVVPTDSPSTTASNEHE
jgi:membrane fusion protein (multidrug efflux system)